MRTDCGEPEAPATPRATGTCGECGFRPDDLSLAGALAALRACPRLWRSALSLRLDDADPGGSLSGRPGRGEWSALEHASHAREVLHALDIRLQRVLREDQPVLPETRLSPPWGANEQGMAVVLAALGVSADQLSRTVETTPPGAWDRTGRRANQTVTALDLLREAVHESRHHLHQASEAIEALRNSSPAFR